MSAQFPADFFFRPPVEVARDLLGAKLTTRVRDQITSGIIVEVEAYDGATDPAAHCYQRRTPRTEVMYWEGGHCYVYFIYGMYHCVNVVTEPKDKGSAVLIRALEPVDGIPIMQRRRKVSDPRKLTSGPGKVCLALGIDLKHLGEHFVDSKKISLTPYREFSKRKIGVSRRIGISKAQELEWRFFVRDSPWVSGRS